jgi:hypothetical protein
MVKLKLAEIADDTPVKVTVEIPAALHRDLVRYGELLGEANGRPVEPARLVVPMLSRFVATDRGFAARKARQG